MPRVVAQNIHINWTVVEKPSALDGEIHKAEYAGYQAEIARISDKDGQPRFAAYVLSHMSDFTSSIDDAKAAVERYIAEALTDRFIQATTQLAELNALGLTFASTTLDISDMEEHQLFTLITQDSTILSALRDVAYETPGEPWDHDEVRELVYHALDIELSDTHDALLDRLVTYFNAPQHASS